MNVPGIGFRPVTDGDTEFLYRVYANTRTQELALVDWPDPQKETFLRSQFSAQHDAYQKNYCGADFLIIMCKDRPAGRLYVARWEQEIRIVDIALLPEYRNAGIGSAMLKDILAEGA